MSLGPPIRKPPEPLPEWRPHPELPHIEIDRDGKWRTKLPDPSWPFGLPTPIVIEGTLADWDGACWHF